MAGIGFPFSNAMDATNVEIDRVVPPGNRLVAAGAALTLTQALHDGKLIALDTAAGSICTLPAASGSGAVYRFVVTVTATSNNHKIQVANANDTMKGVIFTLSDNTDAVLGWLAASTSDTITMNRTTTGTAAVGQLIEVRDVLANVFAVNGLTVSTGTEATPFSAAV